MAGCSASKVFSGRNMPLLTPSTVPQNTYRVLSETGFYGMDGLPANFIAQGGSCSVVHDALAGSFGTQWFNSVAQNGSVIPRPTQGLWPVSGTGSLYGATWTVMVDGVAQGTFSNTVTAGSESFVDNITAGFPLVMGVNANRVEFVRTLTIADGDMSTSLSLSMLASFDFQTWWCCAAASSGCTAGCGAALTPVGSFLIPTPSNPDPVAAQSTTPILNTPLYLSNHTFALPNNFGRK